MFEGAVLLSTLAVLTPLTAASFVWRMASPRMASVAAVLVAFFCCVGTMILPESAGGWLALDGLSAGPAVIIAGLLASILIAAPSKDVDSAACTRMLIGLSGVLIVYAAANPVAILAGWTLSAAPFLIVRERLSQGRIRWFARPVVALSASILLVGAAVILLPIHGDDVRMRTAFVLVVIASLVRSGVFPFHSWVVTSFESDALLPYAWLVSARTGAMVLAKFMVLAPAGTTRAMMPMISDLALFSSVLLAVVAMGEKNPRRVLGLVVVSQSGFIISGLQTANVEGLTGALMQWIVVSVSAVGLAVLLRCLEERYGAFLQQRFAGLGVAVPRMAVLFLIFALALVGFPGTLGFSAEDLLFHGALDSHPILGIALPVATTLIAIRLLVLFSNIFLGRRGSAVPVVGDALPRERWVLTALVALLVISGLAPQAIISSRVGPARALALATQGGETAADR